MRFGYAGLSTEFLSCQEQLNYVANIHCPYISKFEKKNYAMRFGYSGMSPELLSSKKQFIDVTEIHRTYISKFVKTMR